MSHFYTPWKRQKTFCFLTFSGGIEMWHCTALKWVKHLKVTVSELFRKQITVVRVQKSSALIGFAQLQSFEKAKQTNKWINKITFLILACFDSDLSFIYNSLVIQFYHDLEFLKKKSYLRVYYQVTGEDIIFQNLVMKNAFLKIS